MSPTSQLYNLMQVSYDHFNSSLFAGKLPSIMFTVQRVSGVMGYFSPDRWRSQKDEKCHEIAINPEYVARYSIIELMQTLVHEMTHCWQHCYGKPSQRTYHNRQWSNKMESIGLMPSSTGLPDGKKTGQQMSDYPLPNGKFIKECEKLVKKDTFEFNWIDSRARSTRMSDDERMEVIKESLADLEDEQAISQLISSVGSLFGNTQFTDIDSSRKKKQKIKYTCRSCGINVWGKSDLNIVCGDCNIFMYEA